MEALKLLKEEAERKRKALNENRLKVRCWVCTGGESACDNYWKAY